MFSGFQFCDTDAFAREYNNNRGRVMDGENLRDNNVTRSIFSGFLWKFGERITAQLISLVVSIVLARLLTPTDYGIVAMVMVFIAIANVFVSSGLGTALVQKKSADNLDFSSVFYLNIGVGIVLYIFLFMTAPFISSFYNMPLLCPVFRVLGVRIIVASINSVQQAYVSRNMLFKRFFWSTLFGTLFSGIVGIKMAYEGCGVWALVAQYLTNTCTDTIVLWFTVKWRPDFSFSWSRAKILASYGWKLLISGLLDTGYKQLRNLIIGKKFSSEDLAYYNQGDKYPSIVATNVSVSINSVLFPAMSQFQDDIPKLKQMTRRSIQVSSYIMWPIMIGFAAVAEPLVKLFLTDKWLPVVPFIRILCLSYGLWPIHTANLQAINAMGRSDLFMKLEVIKKLIGLLLIIIAVKFGALALAYSVIAADIICIFVNASPNVKLLGYYVTEQLKDLLPGFFMSLIMAAVIYPIQYIDTYLSIILIAQVVVGVAVYLIESLVTHQESFFYVRQVIKKFKVSR